MVQLSQCTTRNARCLRALRGVINRFIIFVCVVYLDDFVINGEKPLILLS